MKYVLSRFSTLLVEICLTIAICTIIVLSSLANLTIDSRRFIETVNTEYQLIINGYISTFRALTIPIHQELARDPSFEDMDRWLKDHDGQFREALGADTYDGFAMTYKGNLARTWSEGDYSRFDPNTRPWYQQARQARGSITVVAPYIPYMAASNQPTEKKITMTIAQQYDEGISFDLDLKINAIATLLARQPSEYSSLTTFLFDKQGYILSTSKSDYFCHNIYNSDGLIGDDLCAYIRDNLHDVNQLKLAHVNGGYKLFYLAEGTQGNTICLILSFWDVFLHNFLAVVIVALALIALEIAIYARNRRRLSILSNQVNEIEQHNVLILQAIAYHYLLVLQGNTKKQTFQIIKSALPGTANIERWDMDQMSRQVKGEYQYEFRHTLTFDNIARRLRENDTYGITVEFNNGHWYTAQIIRGLTFHLTGEFFLCLENADEQMQNQQNLEQALRKANAAIQAKTDFLSRMSHDIRTPLNGIIGMTNIANGINDQELQHHKKLGRCLANIQSSSHFLLSLINDILDIAKIESGKLTLDPQPSAIKEISHMVEAVIRPLMDEKHMDFTCRSTIKTTYANVDMTRLNQILFNLLSNAAKYTLDGGSVLFAAESLHCDGSTEWVRFTVKDTGIGMSEAFLARAFNPFEQERGSNDNLQWTGTGLGLAIAKELTEKMGGTIRVKSKKNQGTQFDVDIPLERCEAPAKKAAVQAVHTDNLRGKTILLAEDNEINTAVATALLEHEGMKVIHAANGAKAVELFSSSPGKIDVILMDIMMPILSGLEATRIIRLKKTKKSLSIPIIAVTANAFADDIKACHDAGMNDHIAKPIDPQELYQTLSKWVEG